MSSDDFGPRSPGDSRAPQRPRSDGTAVGGAGESGPISVSALLAREGAPASRSDTATAPISTPRIAPARATTRRPAAQPADRPVRDARPHRLRVAGRVAIALVSAVSLLLTGVAWFAVAKLESIPFVEALAGDEGVRDREQQTGDETYLIVGVDSRAGQNQSLGGDTGDDVSARSDSVMLVNIPAKRDRIVGVSFPRDLAIDRPSCATWDNAAATYSRTETVPAETGAKLNSAYSYGGPKCLTRVIQRMSGLNITRFIGIDFVGFERLVDEIGGIDICTPHPVIDGYLGTVLAAAGNHHLQGRTALNFVRARTVQAEGNGDYGRIRRQQEFLSAVLRKGLSADVLLDPPRLRGFTDAFSRSAFGDGVSSESLFALGHSLQSIDPRRVTFLTTPTSGTDSSGNETPRSADITAIFDAIIHDRPLPGENAAGGQPNGGNAAGGRPNGGNGSAPNGADARGAESERHTAPTTSSILARVSNATETAGLAASTAQALTARGVSMYGYDNHTGGLDRSVIRYSGGNRAAALTLSQMLGISRVEEADGLGTIVAVVLGADFSGTVGAAPAPGSPVAAAPARSADRPLPADLQTVNAGAHNCD